MENINKKRIYSFLIDCLFSNFFGFLFFSILDYEKDYKINSFIIFDLQINYGITLQIFVFIIYFILFDLINNGQSIGKLMFAINIVNKNNHKKLSIFKLVERTLYKIGAVLILPFSIFLFFNKNGYTIQDKLANTTTIT